MNKFTKEMVNDYADKLLIGLTEEENKMVLEEFELIDANINLINQIPNIESVEAMTHCLDNFIYELDEDIVEVTTPIEDILKNADEVIDREISVPKVVE